MTEKPSSITKNERRCVCVPKTNIERAKSVRHTLAHIMSFLWHMLDIENEKKKYID